MTTNAIEELYITCMNFAANAGPGADIRDYGLTPDLLTRARAALDALGTPEPPTDARTIRTLQDIIDAGELVGYEPGTPPPGPLAGAEIDADVCAHAHCPECGHDGLDYHPFVAPGSYRAFAVCPVCGAASEF